MNSLTNLLQFLLFLVLLIFSTSSLVMARMKVISKSRIKHNNNHGVVKTMKSSLDNDVNVNILYYPQTLDHFNYQPQSYATFNQKYIISYKYWGGAKSKSPILVYLGDEAPLDDYTPSEFIFNDYARRFKALLVCIEHRFYGKSIPFNMSTEEVTKHANIRGYFNSAQALADFAELILYLKQKHNAHYSPIIAIGGSYGGMLASWLRLKYPHVVLGALASSAPVLYFDKIIPPNHGYYSVVTKDFKETSKSCYKTIKNSWAEIDRIGSKRNGLSILSDKFKTCVQLKNTSDLKDFLASNVYGQAAQYNIPSVSSICEAIDNGSKKDILAQIYGAVNVYSGNYTDCLDIYADDNQNIGWDWQTCSEIVIPISYGTNKDSMFPSETFNLLKYIKECKDEYNVVPRPHWITTYYGGHDMKLILSKFGSNIIFSNGLRDPYSCAGVLENLSESIIAIYTTNGTHCQDMLAAEEDDPEWLVHQRKREVEIINGWFKIYYDDLKQYLK